MSHDPKPSVELHRLCCKLSDGDITPEEAERLNRLLLESQSARRFYRTFMALASALETRATLHDAVDRRHESDKNIDVLFELLHLEQEAEVVQFTHQPEPVKPEPRRPRDEPLGWREVGGASGFLLIQAAKTRAARWSAAAAAVLLGAALFFALSGSDPPTPGMPAASTESTPRGPAATSPVATLTAEYDAVWERRPGEDLLIGQRFTLIDGFAEITTARGAVAILEAPATIELLDNDNALRLHTGKLVGICETPSSKGFLVRTKHMDITDLGTRFGVDATRVDAIEAHVIEGEIEVSTVVTFAGEPKRQRLVAGQALTATGVGTLSSAIIDPSRFVLAPGTERLRPRFAGAGALWLGPLSGSFKDDQRKADALQVFIERQGLFLQTDVPVDFKQGDWQALSREKYLIPAGTRVDTYLLHFDLPDGHEAPEEYVVDFDRPILGVIVSQDGLSQTDAALGVPGVTYPDLSHFEEPHRGLNYQKPTGDAERRAYVDSTNDRASVSPDSHQLRLRLWGGRDQAGLMDQVRVIVRAKEDTSQP